MQEEKTDTIESIIQERDAALKELEETKSKLEKVWNCINMHHHPPQISMSKLIEINETSITILGCFQ